MEESLYGYKRISLDENTFYQLFFAPDPLKGFFQNIIMTFKMSFNAEYAE
jgi:hypothetical protein